MSTVAGGVEDQAQYDHLLQTGCDESQGYFHSPPLPAAQFEAWLLSAGRRRTLPGARQGSDAAH